MPVSRISINEFWKHRAAMASDASSFSRFYFLFVGIPRRSAVDGDWSFVRGNGQKILISSACAPEVTDQGDKRSSRYSRQLLASCTCPEAKNVRFSEALSLGSPLHSCCAFM